jgi:hypothetical protein
LLAPARNATLLSIIHVTTGPVSARSAALTVQPSISRSQRVRYAGQPARRAVVGMHVRYPARADPNT